MKKTLLILLSLVGLNSGLLSNTGSTDSIYLHSFQHLVNMLEGREGLSFKNAVFLTENAYSGNKLDFDDFNNRIGFLKKIALDWMTANPYSNYRFADSLDFYRNRAIHEVLKDTLLIRPIGGVAIRLLPFGYNFNDFLGNQEWSNTFVSRLLKTHKGNCHSLPYLYKILSEELEARCWLSFAPNHIYIKNKCQQVGWYNTELTSNEFPVDAWIMASGYVSPDAVRSGIYMDTLSNVQAIANCALDLAKGYERKYKVYTDSFIIKCCDLTLKYQPNNINAIIYKAEILRKIYIASRKENPVRASTIYPDMERLYVQALDLGYKEMPEKMYKEWLSAISNQKEKYSNKKLQKAIPVTK